MRHRVTPAILDAVMQANEGFASAYGDDDWTRSVEHRFAELFEREVAVFLLPTGTAANALALAHVTPPWGPAVLSVCGSENSIHLEPFAGFARAELEFLLDAATASPNCPFSPELSEPTTSAEPQSHQLSCSCLFEML